MMLRASVVCVLSLLLSRPYIFECARNMIITPCMQLLNENSLLYPNNTLDF